MSQSGRLRRNPMTHAGYESRASSVTFGMRTIYLAQKRAVQYQRFEVRKPNCTAVVPAGGERTTQFAPSKLPSAQVPVFLAVR